MVTGADPARRRHVAPAARVHRDTTIEHTGADPGCKQLCSRDQAMLFCRQTRDQRLLLSSGQGGVDSPIEVVERKHVPIHTGCGSESAKHSAGAIPSSALTPPMVVKPSMELSLRATGRFAAATRTMKQIVKRAPWRFRRYNSDREADCEACAPVSPQRPGP
jgi:hypothetical protein